MNALVVPNNFGAVSTRFQGAVVENDLGAGVAGGFGLIGYKGKVWSIRYRGEERQLMRDDGDGPRGSIEVVILKAAGVISKIYYENGYTEGANQPPDCFSTNGVAPDAGAARKQAVACAVCPHNAWGSRVTPAGKQGKACQDSKRTAVVPLGDIANEAFGGPMLLRIPAASLQDSASYGSMMGKLGFPYYAVGTRIAFDPKESYPKFTFNAIRPLGDAEAELVLQMRDNDAVGRILAESEFAVAAPQAQAQQLAQAFEQPPAANVVPMSRPAPAPAPQPAPATAQAGGFGAMAPAAPAAPQPVATGGFGAMEPMAAQPAAAPVAQAEVGADDFDAALDAKLDGLLN